MKEERREAVSCIAAHLAAVIGARMSEMRDSEASKTLGIARPSTEAVERAAAAAVGVLLVEATRE